MAGDRLTEYQRKRDFGATPEPRGEVEADVTSARFVVQEHHARRLHWDLRLEHDGALASWAVPKGIPQEPGTNRLAVRTEDHPEEYLTFHGVIPPGQYGAGRMDIWDRGTYECEKWEDDEVLVVLHGARAEGRYVLFRTRGDDWMLRRLDPPTDPDRHAPPTIAPMLATSAKSLPRGDDWAYELKWDGVRALGLVQGGRIRLTSRAGGDITERYPELRAMAAELGSTEVLLDGELVAFDDDGRPSFQRLQRRMHVTGESRIRRLTHEVPVTYVVFDLCWQDGHDLCALPYLERRARLAALHLDGPSWQTPPHAVAEPGPMQEVARRYALEGVMAKRADSPYEAGRRSSAWRKVKEHRRQELVVGGWLEGQGGRHGTLGALLVGYHDPDDGPDGGLRYAGRVGTGFTEADLDRLHARLARLARDTSPFVGGGPPKGAHFVEPELVVEVRFGEWTDAGRVRHPAFLGERDDVDPTQVVREP